MPKHVVRLILLIVAFGAVALAAKSYFTADSFFLYGHYRGNSLAEIASDRPKYKTPEFCQDCHAPQYAEWRTGVHNSSELGKVVKCEVCHGAAGSRDAKGQFENSSSGTDHPNDLKLIVPTETAKLCTLCHEQMPARPKEQRQIIVAAHAGTEQCATCHNPHSPRITGAAPATARAGDAAAGQAVADTCAACHGALGVSGDLPGPNLAGQNAAYLVAALTAYKTGERDNPVMAGTAEALSDADIENLAAYFAGLSCGSAHTGEEPAATAGQAISSKCAMCHGAAGVSRQPLWPSLAGQSGDYLVTALQSYKEGARKNILMSRIIKDLSDPDAASLAAYFSNATCR